MSRFNDEPFRIYQRAPCLDDDDKKGRRENEKWWRIENLGGSFQILTRTFRIRRLLKFREKYDDECRRPTLLWHYYYPDSVNIHSPAGSIQSNAERNRVCTRKICGCCKVAKDQPRVQVIGRPSGAWSWGCSDRTPREGLDTRCDWWRARNVASRSPQAREVEYSYLYRVDHLINE